MDYGSFDSNLLPSESYLVASEMSSEVPSEPRRSLREPSTAGLPEPEAGPPGVYRRSKRLQAININPEKFTTEKILNFLNLENLELLQNEFEKIVKED